MQVSTCSNNNIAAISHKRPQQQQRVQEMRVSVAIALWASSQLSENPLNPPSRLSACSLTYAHQVAFSSASLAGLTGGAAYLPRIDYAASDPTDDGSTLPPSSMKLHPLHVGGDSKDKVDLTFFADGCMFNQSKPSRGPSLISLDTAAEEEKFVADATKLTEDIIAPHGAMGHVQDLLNVWGVFVPSNTVSGRIRAGRRS